ncbi:uncharacterized protein LOC143805654 [Ranitomeya variabilis]|uniref:uncharacterized protein LOC143766712 n=1 Tax=Ranitomeya variabilis TaxID=490064 RepID=UPI004056A2C2
MDPQSSHIQKHSGHLGSSADRFICDQEQQASTNVCIPECGRSSRSSRLAPVSMELRSSLRLPTNDANSFGDQENKRRKIKGDSDSSILAKEALVLLSSSDVSLRSVDSASDYRPTLSGSILPSTSKGPPPHGVELERQILTLRGFSQELINTLLLSRKKSTTLIYSRVWRKFLNFYTKPFSKVPIKPILEFLQKGREMGLSVNTLRVQVSALGALYSANIASNRWVTRFIRACERCTPVHVPRLPPWDLNLVLDSLSGPPFEPLYSIPLKNITYKVALLIALTSARRVGDIQALSIDPPFLITYQDRIVLKPDPSYLPKVATKYHRAQEIFLPSFYDNPANSEEEKLHMLDVKRAVLGYIDRTRSCRQSRALFVSFQGHRKGHGVTKATLSRWIREAIHLAYLSKGESPPEGVKAHSARAVSSSWAENKDIPIELICKAATWSSPSTFYRHYRLDLSSASDLAFGRAVLSTVIPPR